MNFREKVFALTKQIRYGKVVNYGQIASLIGEPRSSRQVGYALQSLTLNESIIPWWRVVNKQGYLSINQGTGGYEKEIQKELLESEGVIVSKQYQIDMGIYQDINLLPMLDIIEK